MSELATLQTHLRKKNMGAKACIFVARRLGRVCLGNQFSFISAIEVGD
jgi:hypothetical protein